VSDTHPADLTLLDAAAEMAGGRLSAVELTTACLERIEARDGVYGAWIRVYPERALQAARAADLRRAEGRSLGVLDGVPLGLKDVIGAAGYPLTGDSAVLAGNVAPVDSGAWRRLREAGMVLLGHLHCGEFACGTWGRNPWHPSFSPGGSSSGSGVALASRTVPAALGTDTRGSIRNPSAQNGVTGLKPTHGLVPADGIIALSFSYDVVGPMARTAADCAALLAALATRPPSAVPAFSTPTAATAATALSATRPLAGARIGVPRAFGHPLSPGIAEVYARFQEELAGLGAVLVPIDRPPNPLEENRGFAGGYKTIIGAESVSVHSQFAGREHLLREEFRRDFPFLLDPGGTAEQYVAAQQKRAALVRTWRSVFESGRLDAVVEPCSTGEIWKRGESVRDPARPPRLYSMWSDTNFPVVALPAGLSPVDHGPVGMQLIGLPHSDRMLLGLATDYQAGTGYHLAVPPALDEPSLEGFVWPERPGAGDQPAFAAPHSPFDILHLEA
jgi:aspartyl-tRNA(Asn)/glutamyl-tRNA(Gln) amidotransferase subunit A